MSSCPAGKPLDDCPCPDFSKEGFCDWPYGNDLDAGQIKYLTVLVKTIGNREDADGYDIGNGAAGS